MKTRTLCMLSAAIVLCLASCEKERHHRTGASTSDIGFDYGTATGKHLVQETAVNTTGDRVEVRYQWNDTRLVKMSIMDSMEVAFGYTGGKLSTMRCEFAGYTMDYTLQYTDGKLSTVDATTSGTGSPMSGMEQRFEYVWTGNDVTAINSTMTMMGYPVTNTTYMSWSNGNLLQKWDNYGTSVSYQYDNHPTPYTLDFPKEVFLVFQTPEYMSLNNVNRVDSSGRASRVINWTYTTDGYPASNGRSDVGFNYYLYADGDGSTVPGTGDNDGGTGGGGGVTPTPTPDINTSLVGTSWKSTVDYYEGFLYFTTETVGSYAYYDYTQQGQYSLTYSYANGRGTFTLDEDNSFVHDFMVDGNTLTVEGLVFSRIQ
ncbi:MAG: hypothetical protein J6I41_04410 [Bacteroidales bacterium]|nr:hypothetical protein [Bacteroidales bacterium]